MRRIQALSRSSHTHTKVLHVSVVLLSVLFEVVRVLERTNAHIFRIVSLKGFACLGELM